MSFYFALNDVLCTCASSTASIFQTYTEIQMTFHTFYEDIKSSLKAKVTLELYQEILLSIPAFESDANHALLNDRSKEIKEAQDHQTLHDIVSDYVNWFNYQLLEEIVDIANKKILVSQNLFDTELISTYKRDLFSLCKRQINQFPMPPSTNFGNDLNLKVEMGDYNKITAQMIQKFKEDLCHCLKLASYSLKLCLVTEGCVQVVFSIPTSVHAALFPLSSDTLNKLVPLGVTKIWTNGYDVERDKDSDNFNMVSLYNIIISIFINYKESIVSTNIENKNSN